MSSFFIYIIQVSCCFSVLYATFYLMFSKLTFHKINRTLLLIIIPLSLTLPFLDEIALPIENKTIEIPNFDEIVSLDTISAILPSEKIQNINNSFPTIQLVYILYFIGFIFCMIRLLSSFTRLYRLKKSAKIHKTDSHSFIIVDVPSIFSCFHLIFIPKDKIHLYDQPIIDHEKAHIKLWHTLDLICTEVYVAIFWFNPMVYFFRKSIRSIHEFQADASVINNQIKKSHYLELLLKNLGTEQQVKLHSYFNHSLIKKRIDMITKTNSNQKNVLRYIFLIPVLVILFMAFIKPESHTNHILEQIVPEEIIKEIVKDNPPSIFPVQNGSKSEITAVYGKNFNHPIRKKKVFHGGIDIRAKKGTPILATADGTIFNAKNKGDWGNLLVISHADGYETWYAHLEGFNIEENQQVKKGQIIGYSGNTGLSTGPHLHYEVRRNGERMNYPEAEPSRYQNKVS